MRLTQPLVTQAPRSAVNPEPGRTALWAACRLDGNRARTTTITLGQMNDEVAEVRDGLNDDDVVITCPGEKVVDGVTVAGR